MAPTGICACERALRAAHTPVFLAIFFTCPSPWVPYYGIHSMLCTPLAVPVFLYSRGFTPVFSLLPCVLVPCLWPPLPLAAHSIPTLHWPPFSLFFRPSPATRSSFASKPPRLLLCFSLIFSPRFSGLLPCSAWVPYRPCPNYSVVQHLG